MAEPFVKFIGQAVSILRDHIDTDQIIPSSELRAEPGYDYADSLFASWRYLNIKERVKNPDFVMNQTGNETANILVSGHNFGCGSSREHAVWALRDYGFRAILARSFGTIFYENSVRNSIVPIVLPSAAILSDDVLAEIFEFEIDLEWQTVTPRPVSGQSWRFEIKDYHKRLLAEGLDTIAMTMKDIDKVKAYFETDSEKRPWLHAGKRIRVNGLSD